MRSPLGLWTQNRRKGIFAKGRDLVGARVVNSLEDRDFCDVF